MFEGGGDFATSLTPFPFSSSEERRMHHGSSNSALKERETRLNEIEHGFPKPPELAEAHVLADAMRGLFRYPGLRRRAAIVDLETAALDLLARHADRLDVAPPTTSRARTLAGLTHTFRNAAHVLTELADGDDTPTELGRMLLDLEELSQVIAVTLARLARDPAAAAEIAELIDRRD